MTTQELRIEMIFSVWAQVYVQPLLSVRADAQVCLRRRLDRCSSPGVFILPGSIQDRAIKEHSGCQLDEFSFLHLSDR